MFKTSFLFIFFLLLKISCFSQTDASSSVSNDSLPHCLGSIFKTVYGKDWNNKDVKMLKLALQQHKDKDSLFIMHGKDYISRSAYFVVFSYCGNDSGFLDRKDYFLLNYGYAAKSEPKQELISDYFLRKRADSLVRMNLRLPKKDFFKVLMENLHIDVYTDEVGLNITCLFIYMGKGISNFEVYNIKR